MKLKFDYLLPDQLWRLFKSHCTTLKISAPTQKTKRNLEQFQNVTPGDFATIVRRHKFNPLKTANDMVSILNDECLLKEDSKQVIGFI